MVVSCVANDVIAITQLKLKSLMDISVSLLIIMYDYSVHTEHIENGGELSYA